MPERLYPIESTAHLELDEDQDAAYRDEPTLAAASSPLPVMAEDRDYHDTSKPCANALPMALLLLPYALVRHGWATWREQRGRRR
ncbi:hypothetical protein [Actinoplanes sp. NPDC049599]|uniref:hypothetical protein n=1 Tax=Actinoplanes sp. NPDC049599 TaxID=3363903 RepID=UPI00379110FD